MVDWLSRLARSLACWLLQFNQRTTERASLRRTDAHGGDHAGVPGHTWADCDSNVCPDHYPHTNGRPDFHSDLESYEYPYATITAPFRQQRVLPEPAIFTKDSFDVNFVGFPAFPDRTCVLPFVQSDGQLGLHRQSGYRTFKDANHIVQQGAMERNFVRPIQWHDNTRTGFIADTEQQ
jgi:hypothetical protein